MRRFVLAIFIFILIFTTSQGVYAQSAFTNLADNHSYYYGFNALSLGDRALVLPTNGRLVNNKKQKNFSSEAQQKLFDLASQFDRVNENEGFSFNSNFVYDEVNLDRVITYNGDELESISYTPNSDIYINTDYESNIDDMESFVQTSFNLNYQLNNKTTLRAAYDLLGRKWENPNKTNDRVTKDEENSNLNTDEDNSNNLEDDSEDTTSSEENNDTNVDNNTESSENEKTDSTENTTDEEKDLNNNQSDNEEKDNIEPLYNSIINQQGRVGISYKTSDNLIVSADYVKNNIFRETEGDSTVFGLEYVDNEGKLRAKYEIVHGSEKKETITGLELDLKDLASFSASYKLLDPQFIKDKLDKESTWDFGVDINLSQATIFSIDYQFTDNLNDEESEDFLNDKESNINASFKINF